MSTVGYEKAGKQDRNLGLPFWIAMTAAAAAVRE